MCPRDTIQFMRFNYNGYMKHVFKSEKIKRLAKVILIAGIRILFNR